MVNIKKVNKKRFLYPPEFEKMFDYLNDNGKFTANFMINTGCRISEAKWFCENPVYDRDRGTIILLRTKVRAKLKEVKPEERTLAVTKKFFKQLRNQIDTHRILSTNAFNIQLKYACGKAKIKNPDELSSHNIRKTFATWMLSGSIDTNRLAKHLGHTPTELFKDYTSNAYFNHKDKQIMRNLLGDLPDRISNRV